MKSLSVFFLKRNVDVDKRRIDPGLRKSFASVVKSRHPLIVFFEGREAAADGTYFALALGVFVPC